MPYDYSKSGLPANAHWEKAADAYHRWVTHFMGHQFNAQQIDNFMAGQPVAAAKRLLQYCPDASEESVTLALLGQVKGVIIEAVGKDDATIAKATADFGARAVQMVIASVHPDLAIDADMKRDLARMQMVEDISMMEDQIGQGRRYDAHHHVRWNMVKLFETRIQEYKGVDPVLEKVYADRVQDARVILEGIDAYMSKKNDGHPRPGRPKPPGL